MTLSRRPRPGSFAKPIEDLLPILGVSSPQIVAALDPKHPISRLIVPRRGVTPPGSVNDLLFDRRAT